MRKNITCINQRRKCHHPDILLWRIAHLNFELITPILIKGFQQLANV